MGMTTLSHCLSVYLAEPAHYHSLFEHLINHSICKRYPVPAFPREGHFLVQENAILQNLMIT